MTAAGLGDRHDPVALILWRWGGVYNPHVERYDFPIGVDEDGVPAVFCVPLENLLTTLDTQRIAARLRKLGSLPCDDFDEDLQGASRISGYF